MGRFLKMPPEALLLSLAFLLKMQVEGLHIRPQACHNSLGDLGTCMFVWECIKTEGKHLGTCADGFLFGSCCAHNDTNNSLVPASETYFSSTSTKKPVTVSSSTMSSGLSTFYPSESELSHIYKPTSSKPIIQFQTRPSYSKPTPSSTTYIVPSHLKPTTQSTYARPTFVKPTTEIIMHEKPHYSKPTTQVSYSRPPFFKPTTQSSVYSRPFYSRPTFQPASHSSSLYPKPTFPSVPYSKPQSAKPSSSRPSSTSPSTFIGNVISSHTASTPSTFRPTSKRPSIKPSTEIYGFGSSTHANNYWFQATGYTPMFFSTKYPTKPPSNKPQTMSRPTKYPYPRPSWKPQTLSSGLSSTLSTKPQVSPPKATSASVYPGSKTTTSKPLSIIITKSPIFSSKPTAFIWPTESRNFSTKAPISSSTYRTTIFGIPPESVTPVLTTTKTAVPVTKHPPSSTFWPGIVSVLEVSTPFNWFPPEIHNSTRPPVTSNEVDIPQSQSSSDILHDGIPFDHFKPPPIIKPTWKPMIIATANMTKPDLPPMDLSTEIPVVNSSTNKTTTPLPISPCGIPDQHPQKKVVGGKNSAFGSWPWQASVRRTSFFGFSSTHRCGGALISRQWVATAGHCVDDLLLSQIKIRVGEYDFASVQEPHGYVERGVKRKVVHPRYNFFTYENDLALVQLEEAIDSQKYPHISPICLPPSEENLVGKNATVTGWGRLSEGGVLPSILQEVQVPIISNEKCKNMFLAAGRHEYIPDIFMCAGFEEGGRDSCQGDSGGPLQIQTEEGYWFLAGIISWGIGCAEPNMPGVCTRISKFKDWVVQQIT